MKIATLSLLLASAVLLLSFSCTDKTSSSSIAGSDEPVKSTIAEKSPEEKITKKENSDLSIYENSLGFSFEYPSFLEKSADAKEDNIVVSYRTPKAMTNIALSVEVFVFDNSAKKGAFELLKEQAVGYSTNWINDKTIKNFTKDELKKIGATDGAFYDIQFSLEYANWFGFYTKGSKVFNVQISYNPELNWEVVYEYVKKIADSFRIN